MNQDREKMDGGYHRPVLVDEVVTLLAPVLPGVVIDATFGGGGHSRRLLDEFGGEVTVVGIDNSLEMIERARNKYQDISFQHKSYYWIVSNVI